ncbi:MAG TPA: sigma-70 family RNA polymerase sigma factor, partial [Gemmataceae bacterium]|nr:sigma-70 family RNA polymerase sigma factor [Gemmataceae bacterium]
HLAEDAFQAVFVVLAAKADSVRPSSALAGWLYGVAHRTALRARTMADRRRRREARVACSAGAGREESHPAEVEDLVAALDEEIARLPDHYRLAVVLCELQGRGRKDAAAELGIAEGTLSSRLAEARKRLAARLRQRGIALSVAGLMAAFERLASASVPNALIGRTAAAALNPALVPAPVAALTHGVFRLMFLAKLKPAATALGLTAAALLTWALLAPAAPPANHEPLHQPVAVAAQNPTPAPKADPKPLPKGPNKLLVWRKGELVMLDPDGKNEKTVLGQGDKDGLHPHMFALSPDGTKVAIVAPPDEKGDGPLLAHLFVREVGKDGPGTDLGQAGMAQWSGDGTALAVSEFTDSSDPKDVRASHRIIDPATKGQTKVNLPENHILTDWSRDGRYFLTTKIGTDRDNPIGGVSVMNRDGTEHKPLTDGKALAVYGRFSPDGRRALVMGSEVKEETPAEKKAREDAGRRRRPLYNKLTVFEVATNKAAPVADIPLNAEILGFCWSPDGKRIAYVWREAHEGKFEDAQNKQTQSHLVTCDPDGKNQKTLLSEMGEGQFVITLAGVDWR